METSRVPAEERQVRWVVSVPVAMPDAFLGHPYLNGKCTEVDADSLASLSKFHSGRCIPIYDTQPPF